MLSCVAKQDISIHNRPDIPNIVILVLCKQIIILYRPKFAPPIDSVFLIKNTNFKRMSNILYIYHYIDMYTIIYIFDEFDIFSFPVYNRLLFKFSEKSICALHSRLFKYMV